MQVQSQTLGSAVYRYRYVRSQTKAQSIHVASQHLKSQNITARAENKAIILISKDINKIDAFSSEV